MRIEKDGENKLHMLIGMFVVITIVLIISLLVYVKYQVDLKKAIQNDKEIALEVISSIEKSIAQKISANSNYYAAPNCDIDKDGKNCNNKARNESYNINIMSNLVPNGGKVRLSNSGATPGSQVILNGRTYTLQPDGEFTVDK